MMRILVVAGVSALLATAGCMPMDEEVPARDDQRFACNAAPAQPMVGQVASRELGTEAVRAAGARTMRWIGPDTAVTMDYRTDRLNMYLDAQNRVVRVTCG